MLKKLFKLALVLAPIGLILFWALTIPKTFDQAELAGLKPDAQAGQQVFAAAGCSSCHSAKGAEGEAKLALGGGKAFPSDFGTFYAPNISTSTQHGIGTWDFTDFANAVVHGSSPEGKHYYPAFPFTTYNKIAPQDLADLYGYMNTMPAVEIPSKPHDVGFPFNIRRGLGLWKFAFNSDAYVIEGDLSEAEERGRYLVEALGHCAECHTPRNPIGGLKRSAWLAGGPNPDGEGRIPNITPHADGVGAWSDLDLETYFNSGFTPEFDVAGGQMADVVENLKQLPASDHKAMVAYLRRVAAQPDAPK